MGTIVTPVALAPGASGGGGGASLPIVLTTDVSGTLPVANGGTGGANAAAARTSLGLEIGVDVQGYDADIALLPIDLASEVTGDLPVANLNGGSGADATKFWRGDGAWESPFIEPALKHRLFEDWISSAGNAGFQVTTSGSGALVTISQSNVSAANKALGCVSIRTGTTTAGYTTIKTSSALLKFGVTEMIAEFKQYWSNLADATNDFITAFGFFGDDLSSNTHTHGAYFIYDRATDGDFIATVTKNDGAATTEKQVSAIAPSASGFQIFKIVAAADNSNIKFYVNGTLIATHTTVLPETTYNTYYGFRHAKTAGTSSRNVNQDYMGFGFNFSSR